MYSEIMTKIKLFVHSQTEMDADSGELKEGDKSGEFSPEKHEKLLRTIYIQIVQGYNR